jgi:small subunit ribosomal protein S4
MEKLVGILESRLDNTVFRLGFATSRSTARQIVNHGHITVNGKRVTIPSLRVKRDDTIGIRTQSVGKGIFRDLDIYLKKHETPVWLSMDNDKREGKVLSYPSETDSGLGLNLNAIVEFYSR